MGKTSKTPASIGLPAPRVAQYVGVAEVCAALDISRSTLDRQRREGRFPAGVQISKNRVVWPVEVVEQHLATLATHLATHAKADPADLSPAELSDAAHDLAARHISSALGQPIEPSNVRVGHVRPATDAEQAAEIGRRIDGWGQAFAHLPWQGQLIVAGWMFPELRKGFTAALQARGVMVGAGDAEWQAAALQAMVSRKP